MKILLATSAAVPSGGGVASYNQEVVNLLRYDNQIFLITASDECNVPIYKETISTYGKQWKSPEYIKYVLDLVVKWGIDLIINSDSSLIAIIAPFINIPIISVSHFVNGRLALNAGYNSEYLSSIISLSNYGKKYLVKKYNIKDCDKVKVVYNFVSDKDLPLPDLKKKSETLTIVYPGGTSVKKSVEIVMHTLYRLLKTNLKFHFVWIGGTLLPSSNLSCHKETTQFFADDPRLEITGIIPREDSIKLIENSNIFLLPSRGEGCPMTLLEAMRAGCIPIVSDAKHGSREILELGHFGQIVKQGDSKALFETLVNIIKNHDMYSSDYRMTYNFSRSILSQSDWSERMKQIISEALNKEKKSIHFSEDKLYHYIADYDRYLKKFRLKEKISSLKCRIYLEYLYYFVR